MLTVVVAAAMDRLCDGSGNYKSQQKLVIKDDSGNMDRMLRKENGDGSSENSMENVVMYGGDALLKGKELVLLKSTAAILALFQDEIRGGGTGRDDSNNLGSHNGSRGIKIIKIKTLLWWR